MIGNCLIDNSAWSRLQSSALPDDRREEVAEAIESGRLTVSLPFLLEAGYSARSGADHARLLDHLASLPRVITDVDVENRALDAQSQLSRAGHHRLPPVDLIVTALADRYRLGILHYAGDYDLIAEKTDLKFESVWLAPRGSL